MERVMRVEKKEEEVLVEEEKKLTKNQKQKQRRKARKARAKGEEESNPEEELKWCINQIQLGIDCNKLDSEQCNGTNKKIVKESNSALAILKSDKEPIVKKRQLMHTIFGDYRKLMKNPKFQTKKAKVTENIL
jgi:hypothetical protein